jgi:hypothetical protein
VPFLVTESLLLLLLLFLLFLLWGKLAHFFAVIWRPVRGQGIKVAKHEKAGIEPLMR